MICEAYHYLFILCYEWSRKYNGDEHFNVASGSIVLSGILMLNVTWMTMVFHLLTRAVYTSSQDLTWLVVLLSVSVMVGQTVYFSRGNRVPRLLEHFKQKGWLSNRAYFKVFWILVVSMILVFLSAFLAISYSETYLTG